MIRQRCKQSDTCHFSNIYTFSIVSTQNKKNSDIECCSSNCVLFNAKFFFKYMTEFQMRKRLCDNVFYHYLGHYHYFIPPRAKVCQVRRQRQRQQQHHSSTMWCASELDSMIISLRVTSKSNKKHFLKRVHRRWESFFARCKSCDQNLSHRVY